MMRRHRLFSFIHGTYHQPWYTSYERKRRNTMWHKTTTHKQLDINGMTYNVTQIEASESFTVQNKKITKGTLGGFIDDASKLSPTFFCDEATIIVDSEIQGSVYVQQSLLLSSHIQTDGLITKTQLSFCTLKSDYVSIEATTRLQLLALRTTGETFRLQSNGQLNNCAFHGDVDIQTTTITLASMEWSGKKFVATGTLHIQQSDLATVYWTSHDTTIKRCSAQLHTLSLNVGTFINCACQGISFNLQSATWHDCDMSIQSLQLTMNELDNVTIFSPLGQLLISAPFISGESFSLHFEKINKQLSSDSPLLLSKDFLI